jgi:hypothetical protein
MTFVLDIGGSFEPADRNDLHSAVRTWHAVWSRISGMSHHSRRRDSAPGTYLLCFYCHVSNSYGIFRTEREGALEINVLTIPRRRLTLRPLQKLPNYIWNSHWQEDITFVGKVTFPRVQEYIPTGRMNVDRPPSPPTPPTPARQKIDGKTNAHAGGKYPERLTHCCRHYRCGWRLRNSCLWSPVKPFKSASFAARQLKKKNYKTRDNCLHETRETKGEEKKP